MVVLGVVSVDRFAETAVEYTLAPRRNRRRSRTIRGNPEVKYRIAHRSRMLSALSVLSAIALGWLVGALAREVTPRLGLWREITQYSGVALILWATLGRVGWVIQTWGGRTLAEKVNEWLYRAKQWIGTFLLTVSVSWSRTYG